MRELRECTCLHTIALVYERAIRKAEIQCITSKGVDRLKVLCLYVFQRMLNEIKHSTLMKSGTVYKADQFCPPVTVVLRYAPSHNTPALAQITLEQVIRTLKGATKKPRWELKKAFSNRPDWKTEFSKERPYRVDLEDADDARYRMPFTTLEKAEYLFLDILTVPELTYAYVESHMQRIP